MENLENEVRVKFGNLSLNSLRKTAVLLRAINNISRQSIISQLGTMEKPTVSDLVAVLDMEQSIVSQHLGILRRARIVTSLKKGKFVSTL